MRSLGILTSLLLLAAGCGGAPSPSSASASSTTSGSERPVARRIEPTARTADAPHPISREAFEAQWAETRPTEPALDMGGMGILGALGAPSGPYAAYGGSGVDAENPIGTCGADESYALVASYVCPDGSMPLGGDAMTGAGARVGNVGANSMGHIIDLYVVPCPTGPIELYVDLYACPDSMYPY